MIAGALSAYATLPSYRAMLDVEGAAGPADVAIVGSAAEVEARLKELADAGATDFAGTEFGLGREEFTATREVLAGLAKAQGA
jgi:alkanesulfonate monooxygenase SsuD/methylene tetrahydromethanopterin reductase-like flavin-dependent oxidoreductase (luciferase family)